MAAVHPVIRLPVKVTAPVARARPVKVVSVRVISAPARIVPWNAEVVSVTAWRTHQVALHGLPPTTVKLVAVSAPVPLVPTSNSQGPEPVSVNVPVNVAAAGKQYVPGPRETPPSVPLRMVQGVRLPAIPL